MRNLIWMAIWWRYASIVRTAQRQLVVHGIAISKLAEKTIHQRWEVTCILAALLKTIKQKGGA